MMPQTDMLLVLSVMGMLFLTLLPYILYKFVRGMWFKRFWKGKIKRESWTDTIFIDENNEPSYDVCTVIPKGARRFIKDKADLYGYQPVANRLAIVIEGNAIPVCLGGYIEEKTFAQAAKATSTTQTAEDLDKPVKETEDHTATAIYKWVIAKAPKGIKTVLIRPYAKWSSGEFYDAIDSKIASDLLRIGLTPLDLILLICLIAVAGAVIYFGYTNQDILNKILTALQNPLKPIP